MKIINHWSANIFRKDYIKVGILLETPKQLYLKNNQTNEQPIININMTSTGHILINQLQLNAKDLTEYKLFSYLTRNQTDSKLNSLCLLINHDRHKNLKITLYIEKSYIIELCQTQTIPDFFWISDLWEDIFKNPANSYHSSQDQNQLYNLDVAKIAPIEVLDILVGDLQKYLKLPLHLHQLNNIDWMVRVEKQITQTNDGYSYINLTDFNVSSNNQLDGIYFNQSTYQIYNSANLLAQIQPNYSLKLVGGVLADEVSVGKTASIIGLIFQQKFLSMNTRKNSSPVTSTIKKQIIKPKIQIKMKINVPTLVETLSTQPEILSTQPEILSTQPETLTTQPETLTIQPEMLTQPDVPISSTNLIQYCPYYLYPSSLATLIICPRRLIHQWSDEFEKFSQINLNILRIATLTDLKKYNLSDLTQADVILLSTSFMNSKNYLDNLNDPDLNNNGYLDLTQIYWNRIIVDEFHEVLDRTSQRKIDRELYVQIMKYKAKFKWCLSATPFPHQSESFESLVLFLSNQEDGHNSKMCQFKHENKDNYNRTINLTDHLFKEVTDDILSQHFRYNSKQSSKCIEKMPTYEVSTQFLTFSDIEKAIYQQAQYSGDEQRLAQICTNILVSTQDTAILGNKVLSLNEINQSMVKYYESQKILLLEQIKDYEHKIITDTAERQTELVKLKDPEDIKRVKINYYAKIKRSQDGISQINLVDLKNVESAIKTFSLLNVDQFKHEKCQICDQSFQEIVIQPNGNYFCSECINLLIQNNKYQCPITNETIDRGQLKVIANVHHPNYDKTKYIADTAINQYGTKMATLIAYIKQVVANDSTSKLIVFSLWDKMLKLCGDVLSHHQIKYVTFQGNVHQIAGAIREVSHNPDCKVILLSAEKNPSGNNLVMADHLVLLDTVNHPDCQTIEKQAIGRMVRLGHVKSKVYIKRLIMKDTIEDENYNQRCTYRL